MTDEEREAVYAVVDALTMRMTKTASYGDWDGNLPADQDAAMNRLAEACNALESVYPDALQEACEHFVKLDPYSIYYDPHYEGVMQSGRRP